MQPTASDRPSTSTQPTPPPAYTQSPAQNVNMDSIQKQQEELARKAAELDRKEQALRNSQAAANGGKRFIRSILNTVFIFNWFF
jgi:hypothetical protein